MSIVQKSQIALEYDKILNELVKFAKTEQSKKLCLNLVPFANFNDIEEQLIYTREAKDVLDLTGEIPIDYISDFEALKKHNEYFTEEELIQIAKSLRTFRLVRNYLKENLGFEAITHNLLEKIFTYKEIEDKIFEIIDENATVKHFIKRHRS